MDEKKIELIVRASSVFMKYGIKSVTMDDLARELGISKKTFYIHFKDKNDLVLTAIQLKIESEKQLCIECSTSGINAIETLMSISEFVIEHFSNVNPTLFYDLQKYHPEAWKLVQEHKWEFVYEHIHTNILQGIKEGLYRENLEPKTISRYYVASMDLIMNGDIFPWPEFKPDDIVKQILRFQIRGLANENGIKYIKENFNTEINE